MLDYPDIKARLDVARTFTLPFESKISLRPLGRRLAIEWVWFLIKYKRRSKLFEAYISHGDHIADVFKLDYMKRGIERLEAYLPQARKEFEAGRAGFFVRCRVKPSGEFKKHWPNPNESNAKIQAKTAKSKVSRFRKEFNLNDAYAGLWLAMENCFDAMWAKKLSFVVVNFEHDIGFTRGEPTSFVLYDINYSNHEAHCYPVSMQEAQKEKCLSLSDYGIQFSLNPPLEES